MTIKIMIDFIFHSMMGVQGAKANIQTERLNRVRLPSMGDLPAVSEPATYIETYEFSSEATVVSI